MYSIGEKIIYGSEGVFTVHDYSASPVDKNDTRKFYILHPIHGPAGNIIYTPVDNSNVKMRTVMSREEAIELIDSIPSIPLLTVEREKNRRETYRLALATASVDKYVSIIKTVMARRAEMLENKKRLSESDSDYEKKAKFCLHGELAIALDMPFESVEEYIKDRLTVQK